MASRRYRSKNTLNSNISNIDNRLHNLETRPAPRRIAANAIGSAQLQEEAVGEGSIAPGIIDGKLIAGGSVGSAQIQDLIITANKIFDGAITSVKIAEGAVTEAQLAANSVTSTIIAVGAVVNEKLAANAVTSAKIANGAIEEAKIAANAVTSTAIAEGAIVNAKLAANAVAAVNILANAIDSTKISANAVTDLQIAANAVGSIELASNAVTYGKVAANTIVGANIQAGSVTGDRITANTLYGNTIVANTLSGNSIIANTLSGNTVVANTLHGNSVVANTINGNTIIANTLYGNAVVANTLSGNTIVANTLSGNTVVANTLHGNTIFANTLHGNSVVANSLNGNTVIANTLSGNTVIANTLRGNTIIANTLSGNTIIANTLSGNTVIANSLYGNTVVANTLYGNSIIAGSLTGDRIMGTTYIRLGDSLAATPNNYIQFGYITPAGQTTSTPGISGYYNGYPGFYIGGWDRPVDGYADAGLVFGTYEYHTSTPFDFFNLYYENVFSAGEKIAMYNGIDGFIVYAYGGSYTYPSTGDILLSTTYGLGSVRIQLGSSVDVYGSTPALITDGPIRLQMSPNALTLTSDNHGITVGVNGSGIPNQYNIAISDRSIQARLAQSANQLQLNPLGGSVSMGGVIFGGSSIYSNGVTSLTSWQSSATDFSAMSGGALYSANAGTGILLSRRDGTNGSVALFYRGSTTVAGTININSATTVQYLSGSDYRLKENINPIVDGIERLMLLRPLRFNFIDEPGETVDGFLAHEAQQVVPLAVVGEKDAVDEDGNMIIPQIDQAKMVPLLTAALQEAVSKIEALETRVAAIGG